MIQKMKQVGVGRSAITGMPRAARRALERAHQRRGRGGRRGRSRATKRKRRARTPTPREEIARMIRGMREAVDGSAERRFLRSTGSVPVPDFLVPEWKREAAERHAAHAAGELGTDVPQVRFFRTVKGGRRAGGWYSRLTPAAIWLSADLTLGEIPGVVAHEVQHFHDHLAGRRSSEEAAEKFAAEYTPPDRGIRSRPPRWLHRNSNQETT